jgi:signal peptidase II
LPLNRYVLFLLPAALGLAADLVSKSWFFANHHDPLQPPGHVDWWIPGILGVQTSFNGGALFGMFQGGSFWLAGLSLIALLAILVWLFVFGVAQSRWLTFALGLISGGILGNLYDRAGLGYVERYGEQHMHHVRDWIHFRLEGVPLFSPWPNFNIADSLLVTGAVMLFLFAIFVPEGPSDKSASKDPAGE